MPWVRHHQVLDDAGPWSHLDRLRAFRPSVIEESDGTLRMWYSAHDGVCGRILQAVQEPGQPWRRLGISIEPGSSGASDAYGVESPSVVCTPAGFLMAYTGSDGADSQLHMATSEDGHAWQPQGTIMQRGDADAVGATHPCLVLTGERWWLFFSGYDGTENGRRADIMSAVSLNGASWDRVGAVLGPAAGELALSEPSVLVRQRQFAMLFVCDDGARTTIDMATSRDGVSWDRRGSTLRVGQDNGEPTRLRSPVAVRLRHRGMRLWYSARRKSDEADSCRLWETDFVKELTGPSNDAPGDRP